MSDTSQGEGWWMASDDKWYPPEQHPDYQAPPTAAESTLYTPVKPTTSQAAETVAMPGPAFMAPEGSLTTPGAASTLEQQPIADPSFDLGTTDAPKSRRGLILGLGALVLVAGLGFLAFRFIGGGEAAGGADSPEAAMEQLIASINDRDAVGLVDVFDPDEIEGWVGSFSSAFTQFENVSDQDEATNELTEAYASLFESFDYSVTGPRGEAITYEVEPLDDEGRISRVRADGIELEVMIEDTDTAIIAAFGVDASAFDASKFDGTRLELRNERDGLATRLFVPGEEPVDEFSDVHFDVVTVQKDGKWYISIGYSILEIARASGEFDGYPAPDYGRAFELVESQTGGSESPEAVVQQLFNSIEQLDYQTIMQITDPLATPYLHDYQPLIDEDVDQQARRDAASDTDLRIDEPTLTVSEWEGRTLVTFDDLRAQSNEGKFELDTRNWCLSFDDGFDSDRLCAEDGIGEILREADSDIDPRDFIPQETGIVVIERNGRWYLDALGTMGFYTEQAAKVSAELANEVNAGAAAELTALADFFIVPGPIARQGQPATAIAESGSAAVALDLSDYPVLENGFDEYHIAVARIVTGQAGDFLSSPGVEFDGEEWVVVYDRANDDPELPAIAATTEGQLDVELFEATVTEVGLEGFSGQLGGQGRPQVFYFDAEASDADLEIEGARADTVFGWDSNGVVFDNPANADTFLSSGTFVVVSGEPGATFDITVTQFVFDEPEPEPDPEPDPDSGGGADTFDDIDVFNRFDTVFDETGFAYTSEQSGGYFDNCGGPSDPDVTSYIWEDGPASMVLTPFPSFERSAGAFDQLINVSTPCDAFTDLEVVQIVEIDIDNVRIEWSFTDDPDTVVYEHYRLFGNNIVVAVDFAAEDLADQLELMDNFVP